MGRYHDFVYALRLFRRAPVRNAALAAALAVSTALAMTSWRLFDAALWSTPPAVGRDQHVYTLHKQRRDAAAAFSLRDAEAMAESMRDAGVLFAYGEAATTILEGGAQRSVRVGLVDEGFFAAFQVRLLAGHGRLTRGAGQAVISSRLAGRMDDPVLGKPIRIEDRWFTVVGVLPPSLPGLKGRQLDVWVNAYEDVGLKQTQTLAFGEQAGFAPAVAADSERFDLLLAGNGRLDDLALARAADALEESNLRILATEGIDLDPALRSALMPLLAAGALVGGGFVVLSIALVGTAFAARAIERRQEFAVRVALGASGGALRRQALVEVFPLLCVALPVFAGMLQFLHARAIAAPSLGAYLAGRVLAPDGPGILLGAAAVAGPPLLSAALSPGAAQPGQFRAHDQGDGRAAVLWRRGQSALMAACGVLVVAMALAIASEVERILAVDWGGSNSVHFYAPTRVETIRELATPERLRLATAVARGDIAIAQSTPISPATQLPTVPFRLLAADEAVVEATQVDVSASFFRVVGASMLAGRSPEQGEAGVVVLNRSAVDRLGLRPEAVVGHMLSGGFEFRSGSARQLVVIGVVEDVLHGEPGDRQRPVVYRTFDPNSMPILEFVVRAASAAEADARFVEVRRSLALSDEVEFSRSAIDERIAAACKRQRALGGMVNVLALLVVVVLLSGVALDLQVAVAARSRELAIRAALGATRARLAAQILAPTLSAVISGVAIGVLLSSALLSAGIPVSSATPVEVVLQAGLAVLVASIAACIPSISRAWALRPAMLMSGR
jgi:hypothetical protein